ncbi:hypothetical protein Tco_0187563, partial [Tanacetum coccineum]
CTDNQTSLNPCNQGFITSPKTYAFLRDVNKVLQHQSPYSSRKPGTMVYDELQRCTLTTRKCLPFRYNQCYHERMNNDCRIDIP